MQNIDEHTITRAVVDSMTTCSDDRLRTVMVSLTRHLHDFAREVKLTEQEWMCAIQFLTDVGHITDEKRQEFILLSDVLGLSMLVTAQNNTKPPGCTEATVFGPFFVAGAPEFANGEDISNGTMGAPCFVSGHIRDLAGAPIAGVSIDVWQADAEGLYDVQRADDCGHRARGRLRSDDEGRFWFRSILPEAYRIPHDGPVGKMLAALGRHPWRPAHLHFMLQAAGFDTLVTHVFRKGDRYLDSDAVFGVRSSLVADWVRHDVGIAPHETHVDTPFHTLAFDFVLSPKGPDRE